MPPRLAPSHTHPRRRTAIALTPSRESPLLEPCAISRDAICKPTEALAQKRFANRHVSRSSFHLIPLRESGPRPPSSISVHQPTSQAPVAFSQRASSWPDKINPRPKAGAYAAALQHGRGAHRLDEAVQVLPVLVRANVALLQYHTHTTPSVGRRSRASAKGHTVWERMGKDSDDGSI